MTDYVGLLNVNAQCTHDFTVLWTLNSYLLKMNLKFKTSDNEKNTSTKWVIVMDLIPLSSPCIAQYHKLGIGLRGLYKLYTDVLSHANRNSDLIFLNRKIQKAKIKNRTQTEKNGTQASSWGTTAHIYVFTYLYLWVFLFCVCSRSKKNIHWIVCSQHLFCSPNIWDECLSVSMHTGK